ncbi:DNA polymerase III subunit gamma/tau [bacterium]|nr:DNA polymerase III subunit gamma/tau [bacterium]
MSYIVFARKYRPQGFEEVVSQEHVRKTLTNAITNGEIAHSYLFSGPRGIGKTTIARILAKALNCQKGPTSNPCNKCIHCIEITNGNSIDVMEIDAASNRGIDEIRALRENVKFRPASSKYKIYIIDEAHQITKEGFNALLKTLEEPPGHVIFMMATTEPNKFPDTVLSRCQRFSLRLIPQKEIFQRLEYIAKNEKIKIDDQALNIIASSSQGSLRDAESILDQVIAYAGDKIGADDVISVLGLVPQDLLIKTSDFISQNKAKDAIKLINEIIEAGYDINQFVKDLRQYFRNILMVKVTGGEEGILDLPQKNIQILSRKAGDFTEDRILWIIDILSQTHEKMRWSEQPRITIEMGIFRLCQRYVSVDDILTKISQLGEAINTDASENADGRGQAPPLQGKDASVEKSPHTTHSHECRGGVYPRPDDGRGQAPPLQGKAFDPSVIDERWGEVLEAVKNLSIPLYTSLVEGKPEHRNGNTVYILFPSSGGFHKDRVQRKKDIVESAIEEVLSKSFSIKCELSDDLKDVPSYKKESSIDVENDLETDQIVGFANGLSGQEVNQDASKSEDKPKGKFEPIVDKITELFEGEIIKKKKD